MTPNEIEYRQYGVLTFNGRRWVVGQAKLKKHGYRGICIFMKNKEGYILVSSHLPHGNLQREALIHETAHAVVPELTERQVTTLARAIHYAMELFGYPAKPNKQLNGKANK